MFSGIPSRIILCSYRTQRDKVVHLSRVEEVDDLNLIKNHSSCGNIWRTPHVPICVLGLEEETGELSFLHGQQTQFQSSQRYICSKDYFEICALSTREKGSPVSHNLYEYEPLPNFIIRGYFWFLVVSKGSSEYSRKPE